VFFNLQQGVRGSDTMTQCHNRIVADSLNLNLNRTIEVQLGLDYLLSHFDIPNQDIFPRTIATKMTQGRQVLISSQKEALTWFDLANWQDCRISAYRYWRPSPVSRFIGIKNPIPPHLIIIDLDICNFGFDDRIKTALRKALLKIKRLLSLIPTVIWSGNGYHIYIPINAVVLEDIKQFGHIEQVSTRFLRFAEWYLSSGLSDSAHNNTVSLNNCMLRIPGSFNSKNGSQVKIVSEWDGQRPNINLLIGTFCAYLKDKSIKEQKLIVPSASTAAHTIIWIEQLLCTPIDDQRKFVVWMILPQYLMNVKKLSYEQTSCIVNKWLDECDKLKRLDWAGVRQKVKEGFRAAEKGFFPMGHEKLKCWNPEMYERFCIALKK
jgi:Primase X